MSEHERRELLGQIEFLTAERDVLLAANEWRDIASAPRDGSKVDLWSRSHYGDARIPDAWFVGNEWFVLNGTGTPESIAHHHVVTHWKPISTPSR